MHHLHSPSLTTLRYTSWGWGGRALYVLTGNLLDFVLSFFPLLFFFFSQVTYLKGTRMWWYVKDPPPSASLFSHRLMMLMILVSIMSLFAASQSRHCMHVSRHVCVTLWPNGVSHVWRCVLSLSAVSLAQCHWVVLWHAVCHRPESWQCVACVQQTETSSGWYWSLRLAASCLGAAEHVGCFETVWMGF